jgi:hypothetical protein
MTSSLTRDPPFSTRPDLPQKTSKGSLRMTSSLTRDLPFLTTAPQGLLEDNERQNTEWVRQATKRGRTQSGQGRQPSEAIEEYVGAKVDNAIEKMSKSEGAGCAAMKELLAQPSFKPDFMEEIEQEVLRDKEFPHERSALLKAEIGEIVNFNLGCALFKQAQKQTSLLMRDLPYSRPRLARSSTSIWDVLYSSKHRSRRISSRETYPAQGRDWRDCQLQSGICFIQASTEADGSKVVGEV